jgi:hypothetical protein
MRLYRTHEEAQTTYPRFFVDRSKVWRRGLSLAPPHRPVTTQILSLLLNGKPEQDQKRALASSQRVGSGVRICPSCFEWAFVLIMLQAVGVSQEQPALRRVLTSSQQRAGAGVRV